MTRDDAAGGTGAPDGAGPGGARRRPGGAARVVVVWDGAPRPGVPDIAGAERGYPDTRRPRTAHPDHPTRTEHTAPTEHAGHTAQTAYGDTALDGRILDTAEVRALSAAGLGSAAPAAHAAGPRERGTHMATQATPNTAPESAYPAETTDAHEGLSATVVRARFPRADQDLRERNALTLPGWLAGPALTAAVCAGAWTLAATGAVDSSLPASVRKSPLLDASSTTVFTVGAVAAVVGVVLLLGVMVVQAGTVRVLSRFGRYKGTVRRTGLVWAVPFTRRRKVDARLRHWRSRPMDLTDRQGTPLQVMVLVVWQVRDSARARFGVRDHEQYLRQQIEAAVSSVAASLPCDSFTRGHPSLRDSDTIGEEMTRRLAGAMTAAGVQVFSVQPLHIDYAPQVAESMLRRRIASLDASTRTAVLDDVVDTVSQAVDQFTKRALVRLDEDGRTEFVRDLTVAMYTTRGTARPASRD
ncbi:SPFH domain-containing protein [Yinghuangia seranimata]|uniref:SPFH domain-containing protein n=1 Tax=Yinghuangia seranimata TaxID=408067 RepID=UPI00248BCAC4|nr:SPFH domain-containing protein [Yinghuangia seranimata]MDI2125887.1 SPFH domain-containing protein [Yinghuangia seranimata]